MFPSNDLNLYSTIGYSRLTGSSPLWHQPTNDDCMISHFSTLIVDFVQAHSYYAHVVVFLLAMSEAIPVVGTVVPGSTLVIAISALATSADANPWILLVSAFAGAVAGDGFSYWLGRHYHREILNSWPINRYQQFVARSEQFVKNMD